MPIFAVPVLAGDGNMQKDPATNEKPPFFRNWSGFYILVLVNLAVTILLLFLFSQIYE